ncbi:DUF397 domain-containing protein [Streptomyces sp. NPDC057910]|uniref:DUF397 domain-containing protein n=1 Tax=Streptomyces sp. NPDC057910 TaxID=3346278 RepID=UPI0036EC005D
MTTIPNADQAGLAWTKSTYSDGGNNCVEVAHGVPDAMPVPDSKVPAGPAIVIPDSIWGTFLDAVKQRTI